MSSPDARGRSRPLRVAGLVLLGVAVGALLVGLITIGGDDGDGGGTAAPTTSPTTGPDAGTATGTGTATETGTGTASATGPATGTTTAAAPPSPSPAPQPPTVVPTTAAPPPPPQPPPTAPIRVYNNSTIRGLAAEAADDFRRSGWVVEEVSNYSSGIIPTSTVYFRPGTAEEAAAGHLASRFNLRVEPRFDGIAGASAGLIVIVTNDYGSK